ncbi:hypothetical protein P8T57_17170 [Thalassospira sp. SN3W]|uniref:hypothetical protein n=1 Tax=Thalassospira sp. SN3W TaxID=3035476 RepID=UPI00311B1186
MGWKQVKANVLKALASGSFLHESRGSIDDKNLLAVGDVTPDDVSNVIRKCNGTHHSSSPHHRASSIEVHVLRHSGWYIKFYFVDPDTVFISVHR